MSMIIALLVGKEQHLHLCAKHHSLLIRDSVMVQYYLLI